MLFHVSLVPCRLRDRVEALISAKNDKIDIDEIFTDKRGRVTFGFHHSYSFSHYHSEKSVNERSWSTLCLWRWSSWPHTRTNRRVQRSWYSKDICNRHWGSPWTIYHGVSLSHQSSFLLLLGKADQQICLQLDDAWFLFNQVLQWAAWTKKERPLIKVIVVCHIAAIICEH